MLQQSSCATATSCLECFLVPDLLCCRHLESGCHSHQRWRHLQLVFLPDEYWQPDSRCLQRCRSGWGDVTGTGMRWRWSSAVGLRSVKALSGDSFLHQRLHVVEVLVQASSFGDACTWLSQSAAWSIAASLRGRYQSSANAGAVSERALELCQAHQKGWSYDRPL